jgi:hypothetical protein
VVLLRIKRAIKIRDKDHAHFPPYSLLLVFHYKALMTENGKWERGIGFTSFFTTSGKSQQLG